MNKHKQLQVRKVVLSVLFFIGLSVAGYSGRACSQDTGEADPNDSLPIIGFGTHDLFYKLGGGSAVPVPGSGFVTFRITANLKANVSYSCGVFDFQDNVADMFNQLEAKVREIPMQLQGMATQAVLALPGYAMQKINPTLHNVFTRGVDQSVELFRLSYKTCEQMETEMRQKGPDHNPFAGFASASIGVKWKNAAESGENIADAKADIADDPKGPVEWLGGHEYGTEQRPIQINHDLTIAGYNIMLGRDEDVSIDEEPTGELANAPIARIWKRPSDAGIWLQNVVGDQVIITADGADNTTSVTGDGLKPLVIELMPTIAEAINLAIDSYDFSEINQFTSLKFSDELIDALREMPLAVRVVYLERLVSEMALNEIVERVSLVRQMLLIALNHPDNVVANISSNTNAYIRKETFPDLELLVDELIENMVLKERTVNTTALAILQQYNARKTSGIAERPAPLNSSPSILGGGVVGGGSGPDEE